MSGPVCRRVWERPQSPHPPPWSWSPLDLTFPQVPAGQGCFVAMLRETSCFAKSLSRMGLVLSRIIRPCPLFHLLIWTSQWPANAAVHSWNDLPGPTPPPAAGHSIWNYEQAQFLSSVWVCSAGLFSHALVRPYPRGCGLARALSSLLASHFLEDFGGFSCSSSCINSPVGSMGRTPRTFLPV